MPFFDLAILQYEVYGVCAPQKRVSVGLCKLHEGELQPNLFYTVLGVYLTLLYRY